MDTTLIKDILMFTVALYGATLATFTYRRGKPKFEIDYSVVLMALADGPADALKLTILNTVFVKLVVAITTLCTLSL
ncbi:MAG: hypothetical protein ACTJH9_09685, partial [Pseudoalteromonas sp.]|uniref:hypothetical protein n=1 Tax=Pseudoalteromonas sp. TaxID=53249 RepID=UPI003F9E0CE0